MILGTTLLIPLAAMVVRLRRSRYPACGKPARIPRNDREHSRGGTLKYKCEHCRIRWRTHLIPGSNVS
jgi:hypothetical protein